VINGARWSLICWPTIHREEHHSAVGQIQQRLTVDGAGHDRTGREQIHELWGRRVKKEIGQDTSPGNADPMTAAIARTD
jgi:hypothetical protein